MEIVTSYTTIIVPGVAGLGLFALLRQRAVQPAVSGCAAIAGALLLMAVMFAVLITTGRY